MIAAFTEPAANLIDPAYTVNPLSNYYLMAASVPLVGIAGTWVTEKFWCPDWANISPKRMLFEGSNEVTSPGA
jgi:aminobenzoyl-glutamate transport protein